MAELFPSGGPIPGFEAFTTPIQVQEMQRAQRMAEMQEQQRRMQLQQQTADQPLLNQQRLLQQGNVAGQIQRQPDELAREAALAGAARQRTPIEIEGLDLAAQTKVRHEKLGKQADDMDLAIRAFEPVINAAGKTDFAGQNEAWEGAFKMLEDAGHNMAQLKTMPRDQALQKIKGIYNQAVNNAPTIRERIKAEQAHQRALAIEKERARSREKVAETRAEAREQGVKTTEAVGARLLEQYHKDPSKLTEANKQALRIHLENGLIRLDPDIQDRWDERATRLARGDKQERARTNKPLTNDEFIAAIDEYAKKLRDRHMRDVLSVSYPDLFGRTPSAPAGKPAGRVIDFTQLPTNR
jgi:hypothetical protein